MIVLAIFATALTNWLTLVMVKSVGPTKTMTVTFMMPVFGILFGKLMLKEAVTAGTLVGLVMILGSVYVVTEARLSGPNLGGEKGALRHTAHDTSTQHITHKHKSRELGSK